MTRRGITTWIIGYVAGCVITGATIGALQHDDAVEAGVRITEVGDIGGGEPMSGEVVACQTVNGGEMIYAPQLDAWRCE